MATLINVEAVPGGYIVTDSDGVYGIGCYEQFDAYLDSLDCTPMDIFYVNGWEEADEKLAEWHGRAYTQMVRKEL